MIPNICKIILISINLFLVTSCTLSFQNISTHGIAEDLVDENQAASPDIQASLSKGNL